MKLHKYLVCGLILMSAASSLQAANVHRPERRSNIVALPTGPKIKVLLEKEAPSAFLEARGAYRVVRRDCGAVLSSGRVGKRFVVHALQDGLRWGEEYPDIYQISIVPMNSDSFVFVNGIQYKGEVTVYHVRDNLVTIVNEVPIEDYLKSTLAVRFENALSKEAMSAMAIIARTEAYSRTLQGSCSARPWDVAAVDAGYYGFGVTQGKNGVDEAIDWTRYMVLESLKQQGPAQNIQLAASRADELAKKGYDAQKILQSSFPHTKIAATIDADEVAVR